MNVLTGPCAGLVCLLPVLAWGSLPGTAQLDALCQQSDPVASARQLQATLQQASPQAVNEWLATPLVVRPRLHWSVSLTMNGDRPLHWLALKGCTALMETLLLAKADPDVDDGTGDTPLHWAASEGHVDAVALLLTYGADINAQDNLGLTPLHVADIQSGMVDLLLTQGADDTLMDIGGRDYRHWVDLRYQAFLAYGKPQSVNTISGSHSPLSSKPYPGISMSIPSFLWLTDVSKPLLTALATH